MNTIKDKLNFTYNGKSSTSFNVTQVSLDNGMFEETLVATRTIKEENLIDRKRSLFSGVEKENLEFTITLAFNKGFTDTLIDSVIDWLFGVEYYSPLTFLETNRIYYCLPNGDSNIVHTGTGQGYITLNMRTNSPYVYGTMVTKTITTTMESSLAIINDGLTNPEAIIEITPSANGSVSLTMNTYTVQINNLKNGEVVKIYPQDEDIVSSLDNVYHYSDYVGDLSKLFLKNGNNTFKVTGKAKVNYIYQPMYNK